MKVIIMKKLFLGLGIILVVVMMVLMVLNQSNTASNQTHVDITWHTDLNSSLQEAKNTNKPVFIDFYENGCTYCKQLDEQTLSDSGVKEKLSQGYVMVKINTDQNPDLASQYKIYELPTLVILNSNGQEIKRQEGYLTVDQLLNWL
ncbi:MAG: thioredoxin family protein [Methanobacterium paludis]|nr:thioredoxin family protein [Methanobacterium paludis]